MIQPFEFPNGQLVYNAEELLELCKQFPVDATNYLIREDLEKWLVYIGNSNLAECAVNARQAAVEDRQKLEEFLEKCHLLSLPQQEDTIPEPEDQAISDQEIAVNTTEPEEDSQPTPTVAFLDNPQNKPSFLQVMITVLIKILY